MNTLLQAKRVVHAIENAFELNAEAGGDGGELAKRFHDELDAAWTVDYGCASSLVTTDDDGRQSVALSNPLSERNGFTIVRTEEIYTRNPDGHGAEELVCSVTRTRDATEAEINYIEAGLKAGKQDIIEQRDMLFR